jgi:hypothetical protein
MGAKKVVGKNKIMSAHIWGFSKEQCCSTDGRTMNASIKKDSIEKDNIKNVGVQYEGTKVTPYSY